MPVYKDQLGRTVELSATPKRIVSVVPSQTELLYDLGLDAEVIGITKFCVHPHAWFQTKTRIGGTKNLQLEKIKSLQPDLIIANKEENTKEQIEELANDFPVWVSDINTLEQALEMIAAIGALTQKEQQARTIISNIQHGFQQLQNEKTHLRTAYLIWRAPYITIGGDTFIHHLLQQAGFTNIFQQQARYPQITLADLQQQKCALLLLSSEPYPFAQKHIDELQPLLPDTKILLVDGELFSWYGSRLQQSPTYFSALHRQLQALL